MQHFLQILVGAGRPVNFVHGQFGKSHHSTKDIVEIMGNAASQRSDSLHFLRLLELNSQPLSLLFILFAIGDISGNAQNELFSLQCDRVGRNLGKYGLAM